METIDKEANMKEILKCNSKSLIRKYDKYYIRFIGGQYVELPCDIMITEEEGKKIIENPEEIDNVFKSHKKTSVWTMDNFINNGLKDFMLYEGNYTNEEVEKIIKLLNEHENIKYEMYESGMTNTFPVSGAVKIENYTAELIVKEKHISICEAYVALLKMCN